ncbi:TPM domain-containing protein [Pedobacter sp. ASV1-7]|uniref:TPM domain-containing protein n=1 Tax=Pedobacter sp. ASV1-7 TaxID=3145237 RepID=UPI0032E91ACD
MKKIIIALLLIVLSATGFAQDFPAKPNKLVNDYTGTLSAAEIQQLEQKLVAFDDSTSIQVAIAVLKSVGEYDINDYALQLGRAWGVGTKGKDNGVMIVVALGDRKISIQTGYGVEGVLPDMYTRRIIENDIKPYFKSGNYYKGLDAGTDAIIALSKGEYKNDRPKAVKRGGGAASGLVVIIIVIVIIIILKKGGGGGGGSQVIGGRGVADALFWSMLLGSGRGSGGGGWGGGSSGGGGFGGFGGGSFGGGGSSGSW